MKKLILICMVGLSLIGCAKKSEPNTVDSSSDNSTHIKQAKIIAETRNYYINRYVDCEAGVTLYGIDSSVSVVQNSQINSDLINKECGSN